MALGLTLGAHATSSFSITAADIAAAKSVTDHITISTPTNGKAGFPLVMMPKGHGRGHWGMNQQRAYPGDLTFQGGNVVPQATLNTFYLDPSFQCTIASCWGNPEQFLTALNQSTLIHVTDQYVGTAARNRYPLGVTGVVGNPVGNSFTSDDVLIWAHAAAQIAGRAGYGNVFHLFLAPGVDVCYAGTNQCYSPDVPANFAFCAYHGSATFADVGHILYTVQPYANVPGCQVAPGSPNGSLADSNNAMLAHELLETITDPDLDAWWNSHDASLNGQEMADECQFLTLVNNAYYYDDMSFYATGQVWMSQPMYNNNAHGCTLAP